MKAEDTKQIIYHKTLLNQTSKTTIAYLSTLHSSNQLKNLPKIKWYFKSFVKVSELNYPNCIEGIRSHFVASMLKTRRSFSKDTAIRITTINIAQYNDWRITTDKSIGIKLFDLGKVDALINPITSYRFSNIPILDSEHRETVAIFNNIAHGLK